MDTVTDVPQRDRWLRLAIILWIILTVILTVKGIMQPTRRSVYGCFAAGARDFWSSQEHYGRDGYYYGPTFALAFSPFAHLPDPMGATLWNWFNVAVFLYALQRFHREVLAPRWPKVTLGALLCVTIIGATRSLYSAQSNALLLALVLLAVVEIIHRRWWRVALCLALPVHIKIWPLAIAALLLLRYPRELVLRWSAFVAILAAAPLLTHPPVYVVKYYGMWQSCLAERQMEAQRWPGYRDAWTLWETTVGPIDKHIYTAVQLGAAALLAGWCLFAKFKRYDERTVLWMTVNLWTVWQMFLGPGSERLTVIIVAPCAAWLLLKSYHERRGRLLATVSASLIFIVGTGEVERRLLLLTPWADAAFPLGILMLAVALVWPHDAIAQYFARWRTSSTGQSVSLAQPVEATAT